MNTKLRTDVKDNFEKDFFKLLNNSVFGTTMENVRNQRDIKLVTTNERRKAILDISKTLMYKFWYDYIKPKYQKKAKLCYMDTDSFIIHVETGYFYRDIAQDINKWFDTSGYNEKDRRPLSIGIN